MAGVAIAAFICGAFVGASRWFVYPRITLTVYNEMPSAVHELASSASAVNTPRSESRPAALLQ